MRIARATCITPILKWGYDIHAHASSRKYCARVCEYIVSLPILQVFETLTMQILQKEKVEHYTSLEVGTAGSNSYLYITWLIDQ